MRPRFSLRLLLIVFTLIAIALGGVTNYAYVVKDRVRRHKAAVQKLTVRNQYVFNVSSATRSEPRALITFARTWIDPDAFPEPLFVALQPESMQDFDERLEALLDIDGLHTLAIGSGKLTSAHVDAIARLPGLPVLQINCHLKGADSTPSLAKLKLVKSISVLDPLSDETAMSLTQLPNLSALEVDPSKLSPSGVAALGRLPALQSITFYANDEVDEAFKAVLQNRRLQELRLNGVAISDAALVALKDAPSLKRLTIHLMGRASPLKHVIQSAATAPALTQLIVSGSKGLDLNHLGDLARRGKLQELELYGVSLEPEHLAHLKAATSLKTLVFRGNLSDEVIFDFFQAAPKCEIDMSISSQEQTDCDGKHFRLDAGKLFCEKYRLIPCPN
jgi:hypothetical protein